MPYFNVIHKDGFYSRFKKGRFDHFTQKLVVLDMRLMFHCCCFLKDRISLHRFYSRSVKNLKLIPKTKYVYRQGKLPPCIKFVDCTEKKNANSLLYTYKRVPWSILPWKSFTIENNIFIKTSWICFNI